MNSLLIRKEDKNNWERRTPIVPSDLQEIITETNIDAYIEKSSKRCFNKEDYIAVGAKECDDMSYGDIILGIKEIPEKKIINNKVYIIFSHTIKGQKSGMPLLKKIIESNSTLIDYEKICDEKNRRLVYFGPYAGDAGTIDILCLMGEYWQFHGIENPFIGCKMAHQYTSLEDAKNQIKKIGDEIKKQGFSNRLKPLVVGILGYGNVSKGVQNILNVLPTEYIEPKNLQSFFYKKQYNFQTVYLSVFKEEDLVKHKDNKKFDLQEYYNHPENFESRFESYLDYMSIVINAIYWEKKYPRFLTWDALKKLYDKNPNHKLGIADITCDVNGSVECNVKATDSNMPAYLCNPVDKSIVDGHKGDGAVLLAVDNLPCELPIDASKFFSNQMKNFIPNIVQADFEQTIEKSNLCQQIQKATIVYNGQITKPYKYLEKFLEE